MRCSPDEDPCSPLQMVPVDQYVFLAPGSLSLASDSLSPAETDDATETQLSL